MSNPHNINSSSQIKLGALISYIAIGVNIISGLLYTPWMLAQIGKSNYGLYTLAVSMISLVTMDFGISAAVSRFISKCVAEDDHESAANILGIVFKLYMAISALISVALIIIYFFLGSIYANLSPTELDTFRVVYILTAVFTVVCFPFTPLNGILISYERFVPLKLADLCNKLLTVIVTVLALLFGLGLYALVTINAVFNLLTVIIKLLITRKQTSVRIRFRYWSKKILTEIFSFSIWITLISVFQRMIFNITPTILGMISGSASIAIFGVAATLEGYVYSFSQAINGLFLTRVSRIVTRETVEQDLLNLMTRVGRLSFSILGLILVGFILLGREFILLWVGPDYQEVYLCALLIILPGVLYFPQQIANTTIIALNKVNLQSGVYILVGLFNLFVSFPLSTRFGATGACISISIANMLRIAAMNIIYHRALKINMWVFYWDCFVRLGGGILITSVVGLGVCLIIPVGGWTGFLLRGAGIAVIYLIAMWLFGWNRYEKDLYLSTVLKALRMSY